MKPGRLQRHTRLKAKKGLTRTKGLDRGKGLTRTGGPARSRKGLRARPERIAEDAQWSQAVRLRDRWCQWPGCDKRSETGHHVAQKATHPRLRHDPRVGVGLCHRHHRHIHDDLTPAEAWEAGWIAPSWITDPDQVRAGIGVGYVDKEEPGCERKPA